MRPKKTFRPKIYNLQNLLLLIILLGIGYVLFVLKPILLWQVIYLILVFLVIDIQLFTSYIITEKNFQIKVGITGIFGKQDIPLSLIRDINTVPVSLGHIVLKQQLEVLYNYNDDYITLKSPRKSREFMENLTTEKAN